MNAFSTRLNGYYFGLKDEERLPKLIDSPAASFEIQMTRCGLRDRRFFVWLDY